MRTTIASLFALGVLTSCGGGESGGATDTNKAPTVVISGPATAEGGVIVPLSVAVTDDKDKTTSFSLSCDGGTLTGSLLTLPTVTADTNVKCTATSKDSGGKTGTGTITIKVTPPTASLSDYADSSVAVAAGGAGLLFAENLTLDQSEYEGTFNGKPLKLYRINGDELAYVVPLDMAAGSGELSVQIGSRIVKTTITVGSAITVANPRQKIADFLNLAKQNVSTALASPTISTPDRERFRDALPQLDQALAELPAMADSDVAKLASHLAALGVISAGTTAMGILDYEWIKLGADCGPDARAFAKTLAGMVIAGFMIYEGTGAALAGALVPGAGWAAAIFQGVVIGTGVVMWNKYAPNFNSSRRAFWNSCWTETSINLTPWTGSTSSVRTVAAISVPGKQTFRKDVSRSFKLNRSFEPATMIRANVAQYADDIAKLLSIASFIPSDIVDGLKKFRVAGSETVPASRISLSNITSSKVSGSLSASADGEIITLKFNTTAKPEDLVDGKLPFKFSLLRQQEETAIVDAEMSLNLPQAFDAAIAVQQFETTASAVTTAGAETLHVVTGPAHGSVALKDDGTFTYAPSGSYFGPDQFTYIARNADGDSDPATVIIDVTRKFDGAWNINVVSTTTSESEPGLCPNESFSFTGSVAKVSDTQFTTSYQGVEIVMTMSSKDDPAGPRGSKAYSVTSGTEKETGNVSISIPDSRTLGGSNGWSWSDSAYKQSCSGTTRFTGTRP